MLFVHCQKCQRTYRMPQQNGMPRVLTTFEEIYSRKEHTIEVTQIKPCILLQLFFLITLTIDKEKATDSQ